MHPKTAKEARAQGVKHYFTGKPCPVGHIALRWTSTQGCVECRGRHQVQFLSTEAGRASQRESQRKYYYANKDARRANVKQWLAKNPDRAKILASKSMRSRRRATTKFGQDGVKAFYAMASKLGLTVDHIVPLNHPLVCGLHNIFNLQMLPLVDNIKKRNRWTPTEGGV
jgi:5-methylcytosine-specific restriction endonuclease McrA